MATLHPPISRGTDCWARIVAFGKRGRLGETRGAATCWTSRDPGGFAERDRRGRGTPKETSVRVEYVA